MSKYIKLEDAIAKLDEWFCEPYTPTKLLSDLPTIEVSEDCISRADAINAYNEAVDELVKAEMEEFNLGDFTECSFNTTQLKLIARKIEDAPSVVPSRAEGEWEIASDDDGEYGICPICGKDADFTHYGKPYHFCPNCGAKMKGADTNCTE